MSGRMYTSGLFWEAGEAKVDMSVWYSSLSTFLNFWKAEKKIELKMAAATFFKVHCRDRGNSKGEKQKALAQLLKL